MNRPSPASTTPCTNEKDCTGAKHQTGLSEWAVSTMQVTCLELFSNDRGWMVCVSRKCCISGLAQFVLKRNYVFFWKKQKEVRGLIVTSVCSHIVLVIGRPSLILFSRKCTAKIFTKVYWGVEGEQEWILKDVVQQKPDRLFTCHSILGSFSTFLF